MRHSVIDTRNSKEIDYEFLDKDLLDTPLNKEILIDNKELSERSIALSRIFRKIIRLRRSREHLLGDSLFSDPAWDMLLDLAAATLERKAISVSSISIASTAPTTTALRWIGQMVSIGVLVRSCDPLDGRRSYVSLSASSMDAMVEWVEAFCKAFEAR